jgi:hypothetical protein
LLPGGGEQGLLGDDVLVAVQDDDLGLGLGLLEVVGDQADPFVGRGRAAEGSHGNGDGEDAAVLHGFQLLAQCSGLIRAGFPGVLDGLSRFGVVALHLVELQFDAGRQH